MPAKQVIISGNSSNDNVDLVNNAVTPHNWPVFRYGELLLVFAEAMNEAYGPDNDNGFGPNCPSGAEHGTRQTGVKICRPPPLPGKQLSGMQ